MRFTDVEADPISWREAGSGVPVIFLHAMVTSARGWDPQLAALSPEFRAIAWNMPGYGASPAAVGEMDFAAMVALLAEFVTGTLGLQSAHFVGLSVGGMLAQHLAATRPELTRSITVLDASPKFGFGGDGSGGAPQAFLDWVDAELRAKPLAAFNADMIRAITAPGTPEPVIAAAETAMDEAKRPGLELAARLIAQHDALDLLGQIRCPALIMAGAEDAETPPAYARAIAAAIPGANLSIIPKAGHIANLEASDAVNARLLTFLRFGL